MHNTNAFKYLALASTAVAPAAVIGLLWLVGGKSGPARADMGASTETAAVSAGATVTPAEPKLRIEPK